jgi:quinol monooxygenase YgiN
MRAKPSSSLQPACADDHLILWDRIDLEQQMTQSLGLLILTMILTAQAPSDTAVYSVAYFDVMPASKASAVTAFKQYRDMSRKDEGMARLEFFEQVGRPAHFSVIETWANQKAFDAHAAATHTKQWRSAIDSIRLSDYDQRPYKTLSIGAAPAPANDRSIYVITHVDIGGQGTNASELLKRLAEPSRKENGNLRFDVLQHTMRANHFTVIEAWQNQKALDAHAAAAHTKQYRDGLAPISSPERIYKVVDSGKGRQIRLSVINHKDTEIRRKAA